MKRFYTASLAILLLQPILLFSQDRVSIRTGELEFKANLRQSAIDSFNRSANWHHNKAVIVLRFNTLPVATQRKLLIENGIELLDYIGEYTYLASVSGPLKLAGLRDATTKAFIPLSPELKLEPQLASGTFPVHAIKVAGTIDVIISFAKNFSLPETEDFLRERNIEIVGREWSRYDQLTLRIAPNRLLELASYPFIVYIQAVLPDPQPLMQNNRQLSRGNVLNTSIANGGKGLNGEGVTVGVGDNSDIQRHVDFAGRLINRSFSTGTVHGFHVNGIVAGAGNINELYRGYAPKATIISENQSAVVSYTPFHFRDYGMVVTNNSWGSVPGCLAAGMYELSARSVDLISIQNPEVLHVFAGGNSGDMSCPPYPAGFNAIAPGMHSAKNVLTVGATNDSATLAYFSSKGPAKDGRIKPEIAAMGQFVISAWPENIYSYNSGTSMASPSVAGGATLLYQRYRQLNGNNNPRNGLIKAILCNGADDKGNPGPDYSYGFGVMNLLRSIDILEKQHYFTATVATGITNTHTITVPANTAQLKMMLYWNDPAGLPLNKQMLVNDLDEELITPANVTVFPKILDTIGTNVNQAAATGVDRINNIEQITVDNPAAGNYTVKVKGSAITMGPTQEYFLVYDIVPVSLNITYPVGGEGIVPGEFIKISWDAYGNAGQTFNIDYSINNGSSWTSITTNVEAERRMYTWQVPDVATSQALIRITQSSSGLVSLSKPFTIIGLPVATLSASQCEGSIVMQWGAIAGATDYEVVMLRGDAMQSFGVTTNTSWHFNSLSPDSVYWVGVRARINGKNGRRSVSISRQPNSGDCSTSFFDNDLKLDTILSPITGRKFTSSELTSSHVVKIRIRNLDNVAANSFAVKYSLNGGPWITETVNATIAGGSTYEYSFANTLNLSALGNYTLRAVVKNAVTDAIVANDTLGISFRHLDNQPIPLTLTNSFLDNLETAAPESYRTETIGLNGIERYDFGNALSTGILNMYMGSVPGGTSSGTRSFILGETMMHVAPRGLNMVTGTFNLSGLSVNTDDIRLDFRHFISIAGPNNDVWIRGSDTQPWLKLFDFNGNLTSLSELSHKLSPSLEIIDTLKAYGQEFSSSFQISWREAGFFPKAPGTRMYSVDDIRLYKVENDLRMMSIDTPVVIACGLSPDMPVKVSIYNSHNFPLTNVPVKYSVNDGNWITDIIPFIGANTKLQHQFSQLLNLSVAGSYRLQAVVSYPGDSYSANDTIRRTLNSVPYIDSYPHLQNFELNNGGWYAEGANSSWEYGTPASPKINGAASGAKAWKTKLAGTYNDNEISYLYSPCYNLGSLANPVLSFSMGIDLETCDVSCDRLRVEYSVNGGPWSLLGSLFPVDATNWYNTAGDWQIENYTRWHVASVPLPDTIGVFRFRFYINSNFINTREGVAIDDIHVFDNTKEIYEGASMNTPAVQQVAGNNWIDFESNGQLIASIQPNGQNLGATSVQAYINADPVRYTGSQYYLDRNIVIKPATAATDSVTVRLYFTDSESERLINASGCDLCSKPGSAYELGISKYSHATSTVENGTVADNNLQGNWSFIPSTKVKKVPFDKGYYAEFKVKDFSEFWFNNGGPDKNSPLPTQVFDFTAQKIAGDDVLLQWKTGNQSGVVRYEVELARGNEAFQQNLFDKIGEVISQPANTVHQYDLTDRETDKFGARYYRLKIIYSNGSFSYSPIRIVNFSDAIQGKVYPNPSTGIFSLITQFLPGEKVTARVFDTKGRLIRQCNIIGTGFFQTLRVDLSFAAGGIYLLQINAEGKNQTYKLYRK